MTTGHNITGESHNEVRLHTITEKGDDFEIVAIVYELSADCLVILYGGTRPHIGAVGMGQVRPSLRDAEKGSASSSVFTYVGHKEDMVAKTLAEELTRKLGRNTVVVAGIHWDALSEKAVQTITALCKALTGKIVEQLSP
ncbi:hypothetical protein [Syntrophorhabdus aromaticivorans]|jgi:hypothetical protein|uniref:Prenylated flavin chaperone LpdD-like domain-containing protein n=1 Tax=Syntrophorhabdus aromaticivorans TaxID=328301 RepID=A0A351U313_9BACT|nr:hypothetical protein [Syntrophorhabdus aromaticivorans]NLW36143.1 hypothetical protein [Syntrophorhabdus aromaticivorans]HBA54344.1 hypothetical protein [Syntrophorhabdus aromaticivorans]